MENVIYWKIHIETRFLNPDTGGTAWKMEVADMERVVNVNKKRTEKIKH